MRPTGNPTDRHLRSIKPWIEALDQEPEVAVAEHPEEYIVNFKVKDGTIKNSTVEAEEPVMPSLAQVIVWVIVGLIGGSLAGLIVTGKRRGLGFFRNLGMGLIGAFIGGLLFRLFGLFPGLDRIAISLRDVVAACAGSLLILAALWAWERFRRPQ